MAGSDHRYPEIRPATQPPTVKARNAPKTLKIRLPNPNSFQRTIRVAAIAWAPIAIPMRATIRLTITALSAPTHTALQSTGQPVGRRRTTLVGGSTGVAAITPSSLHAQLVTTFLVP